MKTLRLSFVLATLLLAAPLALHADDYGKPGAQPAGSGQGARITILAPKDGETLDAGEAYSLRYDVVPGPGGDHFHVWVDGERGPGVHERKGAYALPKLAAGTHTITLRVVDKSHVPTGPEKTITVKVRQG